MYILGGTVVVVVGAAVVTTTVVAVELPVDAVEPVVAAVGMVGGADVVEMPINVPFSM